MRSHRSPSRCPRGRCARWVYADAIAIGGDPARPVDAYGGEVINGWAARFYPYLKVNGVIDWPNPLLELKIGEPERDSADTPGITSSAVPSRVGGL